MKPLSLTDLKPEGSEFTLAKTGNTYKIRPLNLSDERWLQQTFGADLQKIFGEFNMIAICRIVFHQMEEDSKKDFAQQTVTFMNEEGVTTEKKLGGAELLFWFVSGWDEKLAIFKSLLKTIGVSRGVIEEFEKKSQMVMIEPEVSVQNQTQSQPQPPTGELSSIS